MQEFSPDALVHLAARIDLDEKTNLAGYAANIEGVKNVIAAVRLAPSIRRSIWTSSQLVCRVGYVPRNDTDYTADTLYGQSKVRTERLVREQDGGGREWCLTRPTTVWGPGMSAHYQRFLRMIERGHYFHVGNSPLWKSYSYIENIAYQFLAGRGRASKMPAVIGSSRDHVELREAMLSQEAPQPERQQFDMSVADGFVAALKDDANTLLYQTKQTLWFLPQWAWSPAAMWTYLTVILVALYRLLAAEAAR